MAQTVAVGWGTAPQTPAPKPGWASGQERLEGTKEQRVEIVVHASGTVGTGGTGRAGTRSFPERLYLLMN